MKSEFELYMETGMIGAYQPEMAVLKKVNDGVHPVYRDTVYEFGMVDSNMEKEEQPVHLVAPPRDIDELVKMLA